MGLLDACSAFARAKHDARDDNGGDGDDDADVSPGDDGGKNRFSPASSILRPLISQPQSISLNSALRSFGP